MRSLITVSHLILYTGDACGTAQTYCAGQTELDFRRCAFFGKCIPTSKEHKYLRLDECHKAVENSEEHQR